MIHQEKLTEIEHLTQNQMQAHTHTYTNCGLQTAQFTLGGKKCTQRAVNNRIHREKLTKIGHLTLDHMHAHTYTNCAL